MYYHFMHVKKVDKIVLHLVTLELLPVFTVQQLFLSSPPFIGDLAFIITLALNSRSLA